MPFAPIKDTYFSELVHELTNLELDSNRFDGRGNMAKIGDNQAEFIMASRYSQYNGRYDDTPNYSNYINQLNEQCLTELSFLTREECNTVIRRLGIINERFIKAFTVYSKHFQLYYEGKFSMFDFERDFFYVFNIPDKNGIWRNNGTSLVVSDKFFYDIQDALMFKHGAVLWLSYYLRDMYGIPQPEGTYTPAESDKPNPDRPAITPGFDTYLIEAHRAKLMPYLIENYAGKKPKDIVPMVYALEGLKCLMLNVDKCTQINLINALQKSFGNQLSDSALKTALLNHDPKSMQPDLAKQQKIAQSKQAIEYALKAS